MQVVQYVQEFQHSGHWLGGFQHWDILFQYFLYIYIFSVCSLQFLCQTNQYHTISFQMVNKKKQQKAQQTAKSHHTLFDTQDRTAANVRARIGKAWTVVLILKKFLSSRDLKIHQLRILHTKVKSVLYGSDTWRLTQTTIHKLQISSTVLSNVHWRGKISDKDLWRTANWEPMARFLRRK